MKNEQMLKLSYETDMPAGDQIYCYLSCNVRINKKKDKKIYNVMFLWLYLILPQHVYRKDLLQRGLYSLAGGEPDEAVVIDVDA